MQEIRLTVALELTELDANILEYASFVCRSLPVSKIYFLHVAEDIELPESFLKDHPELANLPKDETLEASMRDRVSKHFVSEREIAMDFEAMQGEVLEVLVQQSKLKMSDLLIVGKRNQVGSREILSAKLARRALCSVLFVPETYDLDIQNILVPVDFSEHSALAAQMALGLSNAVDGDIIHFLNLYSVPSGYYRLGETYEECSAKMESYAEEDYQKFIAKLENMDLNEVQPHFVDQKDYNKVALISEKLRRLNCQLLVMGSKGRTNLSAIFLGSLTEKLIQANLGVPMLVVKKRNENLNFLDALLQISKV